MPDMQAKTEKDSKLDALFNFRLTRRELLKLLGLGGTAATLSACHIPTTPPQPATPGTNVDTAPTSKDLPPVPEAEAVALYRYSAEQIPSAALAKFEGKIGKVKFLWAPLVSQTQHDIAVNELHDTAPGQPDKIVSYAMGVVAVKPLGKQTYETHMCLITFAGGDIQSLTVAGMLDMNITQVARDYVYPQAKLTSEGIVDLPVTDPALLSLHVTPDKTTFTYNFPEQGIQSNGPIAVPQAQMEKQFREFAGIDVAGVALELNMAASAEVVAPDAETIREVQAALQRITPDIDLTKVVIANIVIRTAGDQDAEPITLVLDKNGKAQILDANGTAIPNVSLLGTYYRAKKAVSTGFQDSLHNAGFKAASLGPEAGSGYMTLQELSAQLQKDPTTGGDIVVVGDGTTIQIAFPVELGTDGTPTPTPPPGPQASLVLLLAHTGLGTKNLPPMDKSVDVGGNLVKELVPGIERGPAEWLGALRFEDLTNPEVIQKIIDLGNTGNNAGYDTLNRLLAEAASRAENPISVVSKLERHRNSDGKSMFIVGITPFSFEKVELTTTDYLIIMTVKNDVGNGNFTKVSMVIGGKVGGIEIKESRMSSSAPPSSESTAETIALMFQIALKNTTIKAYIYQVLNSADKEKILARYPNLKPVIDIYTQEEINGTNWQPEGIRIVGSSGPSVRYIPVFGWRELP